MLQNPFWKGYKENDSFFFFFLRFVSFLYSLSLEFVA